MTEQDELSRLARAITEAEDTLSETNHRDDCQQLAEMDETRSRLVERIAVREQALSIARLQITEYLERTASESAVKVAIDEVDEWLDQTMEDRAALGYAESNDVSINWHVAEPTLTNGLDGYQED